MARKTKSDVVAPVEVAPDAEGDYKYSEQTIHSILDEKGNEVFYRVTHLLDIDRMPTGEGWVDVSDVVEYAGTVEKKWRATNCDYKQFMRQLHAREAERKDYQAEIAHGEMTEHDVEVAERNAEDERDLEPEEEKAADNES